VNASDFYSLSRNKVLLDIRSPGEFLAGHIPGAVSFPLFTDEERAIIGKLYKQQGHDFAVKKGLSFVAPKMVSFVTQAEHLSADKELFLYCWRGGMRSKSMEWLLSTAGFNVTRLEGGYKAFRESMRDTFLKEFKYLTLSGNTGTGKTAILQELDALGQQVLDLEGLADHYGSAFGDIHSGVQPSTEHFNNLVFEKLESLDSSKIIWVEDESKHIGKVWMDEGLFDAIKKSPMVIVIKSFEERVEWLCKLYGKGDHDSLKDGFRKIEKRLGPQHAKIAIEAIEQEDLAAAARIALQYYDKSYEHLLSKRIKTKVGELDGLTFSHREIAEKLIEEVSSYGG
jgi:tRNA 2-selenouridine synthase